MQLRFPRMPEQLTRADALILDYISNNTEGFLFSSIGQLARALGLSEATISRFVRHVGCNDFKDLKQVVMRQAAFDGPDTVKKQLDDAAGIGGRNGKDS